MGKLTISRLALAMTISGLLAYPATPTLAAPKWLQEMFTVDPPKPQRQKKQRRAKAKPAQQAAGASGNVIRLPATAPVPESAPRDAMSAGQSVAAPVLEKPAPENPMPEDKLPPGATDEKVSSEEPAEADAPKEDAATETAEPLAPKPLDNEPTDPPKPEPRPEDPKSMPEAQAGQPAGPEQSAEPNPPAESPIPEFRPDKPDPTDIGPDHERTKADKAKPGEPPPPPDPRSARRADPSGELPDDEAACRWRLTKLGVKFREVEEETDPTGCSIPYPIVIENLGTDIGLQPRAEMNCAMAEAAVRFAKSSISTAAKNVFGTSLKSIAHASAFVCRPRNGSHKLSEHAFGNALDIASFTLSDGTVVAVEPAPPEKHGEFLGKVRQAACGPFKTVLGPGSDADHAEHFHFDLAPRRNGGTVCE